MAETINAAVTNWIRYWVRNEFDGNLIIPTRINGLYTGTNDDDYIAGGRGNDTIYGRDDSDSIGGRSGNDTLYGEEGSDSLYGEQGNDVIIGGNGDDFLSGEDGNDFLRGDTGSDLIIGGAGIDTVDFSTAISGVYVFLDIPNYNTEAGYATTTGPGNAFERDRIGQVEDVVGSAFGDTITGSALANVLEGMQGNDRIHGQAGNDDIYGGIGKDTLEGGAGSDVLAGEQGNDSLRGGAGIDYLYGDEGDDVLDGGTERDLLYGGDGADTLRGGAGNDDLNGGGGVDLLEGGDGNDVLRGQGNNDALYGGLGNDTYVLDATSVPAPGIFGNTPYIYDRVFEGTNGGIDTIQVARALKSFFLGNPQDFTSYALGANIENGTVIGTDAFSLFGNTLNNQLIGNASANTLSGGGGNDTLNGGLGFDTLIGGTGNDTYVLASTSAPPAGTIGLFPLNYDAVTEDADGGIDTILVARALQSGATLTDFTLYALGANIENATVTGQGAFDLIGNELANQLTGNGSDNVLTGGAGHDYLDGRGGQDTLLGGTGNDTYILRSTSTLLRYDGVIEAAGEGTDTVFVSKGRSSLKGSFTSYTLGANIENGQIVDTGVFGLRGNALANRLTGDLGANHLRGEGGADTLIGGAGSDVLEGGLGFDVLSGGTGSDIFRWRSIGEMGTSAASIDRVVSFSRSQGDQLHLASIDAGAGSGNQAFVFRGTAAFTAAGQVRVQQSGSDTLILLNMDKDSSAEGVIRLTGIHNVQADWFVL